MRINHSAYILNLRMHYTGTVKNYALDRIYTLQFQPSEKEGGLWVRIPSGAQIFFCVLLWLILYISLYFLSWYLSFVENFPQQVICLSCNSCRDLDLCRDPFITPAEGNKPYAFNLRLSIVLILIPAPLSSLVCIHLQYRHPPLLQPRSLSFYPWRTQ